MLYDKKVFDFCVLFKVVTNPALGHLIIGSKQILLVLLPKKGGQLIVRVN